MWNMQQHIHRIQEAVKTDYTSGSRIPAPIRGSIIPSIMIGITVAVLAFIINIVKTHLLIGEGSRLVIFASFGSSAFILYMFPRSRHAKIYKFAGSYFVAAVAGIGGTLLIPAAGVYYTVAVVEMLISFIIVIAGLEHPPAVAIGIVFVIGRVGLYGLLVIVVGVAAVSLMKTILEKTVYKIEEDFGMARE
jgi:CBS-domain-containing membrane protein